jgi:hypothetical protein
MERRIITGSSIRAASTASGNTLEGLAARYNSRSQPIRDAKGRTFHETIARGAFKSILASNPDVRCLFNHDPNKILGRTTARTLTLSETTEGLAFRCDLPDTQAGRDVHAMIQRGDINQCSFGFNCDPDDSDWSQEENSILRTIRNFRELSDVSPVTFPAYEDTTVAARSLMEKFVEARTRVDGDFAKVPAYVRDMVAKWGTEANRAAVTQRQRLLEIALS